MNTHFFYYFFFKMSNSQRRGPNFSQKELSDLASTVKNVVPINNNEWIKVKEEMNSSRSSGSLKKRFRLLMQDKEKFDSSNRLIDGVCPEHLRLTQDAMDLIDGKMKTPKTFMLSPPELLSLGEIVGEIVPIHDEDWDIVCDNFVYMYEQYAKITVRLLQQFFLT